MFCLFSRGNNMSILAASGKPYQKETRNLSDKNCVVEMMKNVADFLTHQGYPEYVSFKEIQKIDKQSFVKYFNVNISAISYILNFIHLFPMKLLFLIFYNYVVHLPIHGFEFPIGSSLQ